MAIIAKDSGGGDFKPAPEGVYQAVCCDVIDKGMVASTYLGETRMRHMVQLRWQLDGEEASLQDDGRPWLVMRSFTLSLHENSALRPFLELWRGVRFKQEELKGFDVEKLIGANCTIQVLHEMSDDGTRTYANVASIMPPPKGAAKIEVREYQRVNQPTEPEHGDGEGMPF